MFGRSKTNQASTANHTPQSSSSGRKVTPSVISVDMNILGNIISDGFLDINGRVEGNVKCESTTIREQGHITGDVVADTIQIYGKIEGLVKAKHVNLFSTAHVTGVIMHESLSIEDGAFVDGKFKRTDKVFIDDDNGFFRNPDERDTSDSEDDPEGVMDNLRLIGA